MLFLNFSGLNYEKYLEYRRIIPIYLTSAHGLCGLTEKMLIHFFHKKIVCSDVFLYIGRRMTDIPTGRTGIRRDFRNVRRALPTLGEAFEMFDGLPKRSENLSKCSTGCPNAPRSFRNVRRAARTLREVFEMFDGLPERSEKLSKCSTGSPNVPRDFRNVRRATRILGEAFEMFDRLSERSERLSNRSTEKRMRGL